MSASQDVQQSNDEDPSKLFDPGRVLCAHGAHGTVLRAAVAPRLRTRIGASSVAVKIVPVTDDYAVALKHAVDRVKECGVQCPQLVRYFGAWPTSQRDVWVASELVEGGSARGVLTCASSTEVESCIAYITQQMLIGLQHLHTVTDIAHGNIRASNILLAPSAAVKLADYGVYRVLNSAMETHQCYSGARLWPPPEDATAVSKAADIWALAVTVAELADGSPLLSNTRRTGRRIPRVARPANWSVLLNQFISTAASTEPHRRPTSSDLLRHPFVATASASVLADVLDRALARQSTPEERCVYRRDDVVENLYRSGNVAMRVPIIQVDDIPMDAFCGKKVRRVSNSAVVEQSLWFVSDALKEIIDTGHTEQKDSVVQSSRRVSQWLDTASRRQL